MWRVLAAWVLPCLALASELNLSWVAPTQRVDGSAYTNPGGYRLWERCDSNPLALLATAGPNDTTYRRTGIQDNGQTCFWSLLAFDLDGIESARTNEVSKAFPASLPGQATNLVITWAGSQEQLAMPFSRRGGSTLLFNPATSGNLVWPASVTANDIAVVVASWYDNGTVDKSPFTSLNSAGFTEQTVAGGLVLDTSGGIESRMAVFTKACAGTETGNLNVSFGASVFGNVTLDVYQGDGDLTFNSISAANTGTGSDATAPSVSGTAGQGLVAAYGLTDPPGTTNSGPSGMTLGSNATTNTNSARTYHQALSSTGATGVKTWDFTDTRDWGGLSILIDDAGGGAVSLPPVNQPSRSFAALLHH